MNGRSAWWPRWLPSEVIATAPSPRAKAFIARKRAEGKSWREALRALKRHLARVVFRILQATAAEPTLLAA